MSELNLDTTEKIVSVIAGLIAVGGAVLWLLRSGRSDKVETGTQPTQVSTVTQNVNVAMPAAIAPIAQQLQPPAAVDIAELKRTSQILFIDDDRGFKIVGVLKKMGWENTKLLADISSLEQFQLMSANCWVPCDHWPTRSWPLYRARQVMREVLSNGQQRSTT